MIRRTRLAAAFAFGAGLTMTGAVLAQTQSGSAAPATASAEPALPPAQSTSWDPDASQAVYSVPPPPDSSSGIDLPTAVGGYARSVAGCVLIGCDDGPQVTAPSGPSSPGSDEPPQPDSLRTSDPR